MWGGLEVGNPVLTAPGSGDFTGIQLETCGSGEKDRKRQGLTIEDADDLCLRYRPLAMKIACSYRNRGVDLDELRSAGLFGLVLATKKFDPDRGIAFGGYAQYWIKGQILELFKPKADAIGIGRATSLNNPAWADEDQDGNTKLDLIPDESAPIATVDVGSLDERERAIFGARIEGKTLEEIGNGLGVSRERVRQINERVVEQVRTKKGNIARACIRDLISRRGYKRPSHRLLPHRSVKYPCRTYSAEEIAAFVASRPDLVGGQ